VSWTITELPQTSGWQTSLPVHILTVVHNQPSPGFGHAT